MQQLLDSDESVLDTGPAGTTYRFLTAFYALQEGTQILTGSDRMKNRPIGPLVDALRSIGANIQYLESEGYPPLQIQPPTKLGMHRQVKVQAGISSQFISALLMIAPSLPSGLDVILEGSMVSRSYLEMTLSLMSHFGVNHKWSGNTISIAAQKYRPKPFEVEGDWSAASYHYTNTVFAVSAELELKGLFKNSWQGDATSLDLFDRLGVQSTWTADGVVLTKKERQVQVLDHNFINCPDIAQTMSVVCAGLGVPGIFSGLDTL
ncbi:MAG: 3-phosphoshikimate 1-carboxyvinyltransferase, partial [Saprospiraceae bacterium]|nr:3-phosphoshikimate 1-carboxyvinyltransferase [Saprospiraceae bacterium]